MILRIYTVNFADPLIQDWYNHSGFANFGYWDQGIATAADASRNLVRRLLAMIPPTLRVESVLDVACGVGATTLELSRAFPHAAVTAINIAPDQLESAAARVQHASFLCMDATRLAFPPAAFDIVVCIEAAHHFNSRAKFLAEAYRVLRPGGVLLLTDALARAPGEPLSLMRYLTLRRLFGELPSVHPDANVVANLAAYEDLLRVVGFEPVVVEDGLEHTWHAFYRRHCRYLLRLAATRPRLLRTVIDRMKGFLLWKAVIYAYPLVMAQKPKP